MKKINFKLTDGLDTWKFTIDDENVEVMCGAEAFESFKSICRILGSWVSLNHPQSTAIVKACPRCGYELTPFKGGKYAWWCNNCHIPTDDPAPAAPVPEPDWEGIAASAAENRDAPAAPQPWLCEKCGSDFVLKNSQRTRGRPDAWICQDCKHEMLIEPARKSPNDG